MDGCLCGCCS
jgi:hypothetical protein